jgi:hypothetical protein
LIYCVVPEPLAGELFGKLSAYYAGDPNVTVIVDRRRSTRRRGDGETPARQRRARRDRRRPRATGDFPPLRSAT